MSNEPKVFQAVAAGNESEEASSNPTTRICVDCDGTLFQVMGMETDVNEDLFRYLKKLKDSGFEVIIFSNDSQGNQGRVDLMGKRFGDKIGYFGEVREKSEFEGEEALIVIDDDHHSHRVKSVDQWNPADPATQAMIKEALDHPLPIMISKRVQKLG